MSESRSEQFEQDDREALAEVLHERFSPPWVDHWSDLDEGQRRDTEAWGMADAIVAAGFRRSPAPQQVSTGEWVPTKWHDLNADDDGGNPTGDTIRLTWDDGTVIVGRLTDSGQGSGHHHRCRVQTVFGGDTWVWPHGSTLERLYRPEGGESA